MVKEELLKLTATMHAMMAASDPEFARPDRWCEHGEWQDPDFLDAPDIDT